MASKEDKAAGKAKEDAIAKIESDLFNSDGGKTGSRQARERVWYRNILYYMGEQWIEWSKTSKRFEAVWQFDEVTEPQPVTNIILDYVRSVKALILNKDVKYKVWPNSNDRDDLQSSELGELVLRDMDAKDGHAIEDEKEGTVLWMTLTGTGFIRDYPDMGLGKWIGSTGKKTGDVATETVMPFNVFVGDTAGTTLRKKPMIGIQGLKDKAWVKDTFPEYKGGSSGQTGQGHDYQRSLMEMIGNISEWKGSNRSGKWMGSGLNAIGATISDDMVLFKEIEIAPTKEYPKGRYIVRVDGQTLLDVPRMPIPVGTDGSWFYTLEEVRHNLIPGGFWGEAGVNALISPQNAINRIDQKLIKNRDDIATPTITGPTGMSFQTKSRRGASVKVVEFDPFTSGGMVPNVHRGTPLPDQILKERSIQREAVQDSSGDPKGVLRGQAPSGSSGVMVDILRETAEAGHAPDVARVVRAFQRSARKRLIIAQEVFTEQRVLKIAGNDGKISVKTFKGAELRHNTDVRLEVTTGFSTTNAGKVSAVTNLITAGIFNPQIVDLQTREELTRLMGLSGFNNKVSADAARAEAENTLLANGEADKVYIEVPLLDEAGNIPISPVDGSPMANEDGTPLLIPAVDDPLFDVDDHAVHYEVWRQFVISPQFQDLDEKDKVIAMAHGHAHKKRIDVARMTAQADAIEDQDLGQNQQQPAEVPA